MVTPARTEAEFVELWRRVTDGGYSTPIEQADGVGFDTVHMHAAQFAALEAQQLVVQQAYYLRHHSNELAPPAQGARQAIGNVLISRKDGGLGARVLQGPQENIQLEAVMTDSMGVERVVGYYELAADVLLAQGNVGPVTAGIQAVVPGWAGNKPAGVVTRFRSRGASSVFVTVLSTTRLQDVPSPQYTNSQFSESQLLQYMQIPGMGSEDYPRQIIGVAQGASLGMPTVVTVSQPIPVGLVGTQITVNVLDFNDLFAVSESTPLIGGVDGTLDAIGFERDMLRVEGETDDAYRDRLSRIPDIISPNAMRRIAHRTLDPLGIAWHFKEIRRGISGFVLDVGALDAGTLCGPGTPLEGGVLLSAGDSARFFMFCVGGPVGPMGNPALPLDDMNAGGNAYDNGTGPGDGEPVLYYQAIDLLWQQVNAARLAGVKFVIVQDLTL